MKIGQAPYFHELTMTVLMTPDMANFAGNVHGGTILKFLDQALRSSTVAPAATPTARQDLPGALIRYLARKRIPSPNPTQPDLTWVRQLADVGSKRSYSPNCFLADGQCSSVAIGRVADPALP